MKPVADIKFGFSDAENYRRRENKELFNKIFLRTDALQKIEQSSTFFMVGEKGTGKTAYAVYLSNSPTNNSKSVHKFIRETDYSKFITLKRNKHLTISEYIDIWKVIILLIVAKEISEGAGATEYLLKFPKFRALSEAIDDYYGNAFSPEIVSALQFVEHSESAVKIMAKHTMATAGFNHGSRTSAKRDTQEFQTNLSYIKKDLQDALSSIKLSKNNRLFIDGIDIRPSSVPYSEYLECVKGLGQAVWDLNNDFFSNIKDSPGRIRCILLLRPDIFNSLSLPNRNTKLKDNSVLLSWVTDDDKHRSSQIFQLADRMFSSQQINEVQAGEAWDYYFPFNAPYLTSTRGGRTSFIPFLRYSYYRPRDILTMLDFLRELYVPNVDTNKVFSYSDVDSLPFRNLYGQYLLGEIKDSLSFYYTDAEYEFFLKFFEYLNGASKFNSDEYHDAFQNFSRYIASQSMSPTPRFMRSPEDFLQLLYDQNIVGFIEVAGDKKFSRWCFRERTPTNISPKVKMGLSYAIHQGLAVALNIGKPFQTKPKSKFKRSQKVNWDRLS